MIKIRSGIAVGQTVPRVFVLSPILLAETRKRVMAKDATLRPVVARLAADADKTLGVKPVSVMDKTLLPPSGDKHDYISLAPYFWPDPTKKDGLPYIRRDGEHNPEADQPGTTDARRFGQIGSAAETLSIAYYFTGKEAYAAHAARLIRVWFLDTATRMNPNLNYAQAVRGVNDGRGIGIIETARLTNFVDSIGLLAGSQAWSASDQAGMTLWMKAYLAWMRTSKNGKDEKKASNNHGTYYDMQVVSLALFTGQDQLARQTLEEAKTARIARQIEPDGKMPLELARTKALSYSVMNLIGLEKLAALGERANVDLWGFQTTDGRGIRKALDYLAPFVDPAKLWPYKQIANQERTTILPLLRQALPHYPSGNYQALLERFGTKEATDRSVLLTPPFLGRKS